MKSCVRAGTCHGFLSCLRIPTSRFSEIRDCALKLSCVWNLNSCENDLSASNRFVDENDPSQSKSLNKLSSRRVVFCSSITVSKYWLRIWSAKQCYPIEEEVNRTC